MRDALRSKILVLVGELIVLGLTAAPGAIDASAESHSEIIGPVHIVGKNESMRGPFINHTFYFPRPGMLRKVQVRLLDENKAAVTDPGRLCHATFFRYTDQDRIIGHGRGLPISDTNILEFPKGFGFPIKRHEKYLLNAMLQSDSADLDRRYFFEYVFDVADTKESSRLKSLDKLMLAILAKDAGQKPLNQPWDWRVPPGRHDYSREKVFSFTGKLHHISVHLHRYATQVRLEEVDSSRTLYEGSIQEDQDRLLLLGPFYSSPTGIPIVAGKRYRWTVTYDNPTGKDIYAMGVFNVFYHVDIDALPNGSAESVSSEPPTDTPHQHPSISEP